MTRRCLILSLLFFAGCRHVPPSLTPHGAIVFRANEAAHRLGQIQTLAIGLNGANVLPTAQTRLAITIIDGAVTVIGKAPDGWRSTLTAALEALAKQLSAVGQSALSTYVLLAEALLNVNDAARDLPGPLPTDDEMSAVFASTIAHVVTEGNWWLAAHPAN